MSIFRSAFEKFSADNAGKMIDQLVSLNTRADQLFTSALVNSERLEEIAKSSVDQVKVLRDIKRIMIKGSTVKDKADAVKENTKDKKSGDTSIFTKSGDKVKGVVANIKEAAIGLALMAGALILFIPAIALAGILISPKMIPGILAVTVAMALMSVAFAHLVSVLAEKKVDIDQIVAASFAMVLMGVAIVATSLIFLMLPDQYKAPDPLWTLLAGFSILIFSAAAALLLKGGGRFLGRNKSLTYTLPLLVIGLALAIVAAAYIFQLLPDKYIAPPLDWSFQVGMALLAFSFPAMVLSLMGWSFLQIVTIPILIVALSAALLGAAYLLSFAPKKWISPPLEWSLGVGVALLMFGLVAAGLGKIVQLTGGPVNFLIGALALIVLAVVIDAIAWILMALPPSLFKKGGVLYQVADTMEYFGYKMVNVFVYLVKELMPYVKEFITFMANLFVEIFPKIVDPLNRFIDALATSFGRLLDHVVPLITAAFNGIATVLNAAAGIIVPIINVIKDVILGVLDFIIKGFQEFRGFINDLASIGAGNIAEIGLSLGGLAVGLAAVMAIFAGGTLAKGAADFGSSILGIGTAIADGVAGFFGAEKSDQPKMDPQQFISFLASNIGAIESAATALEKIAKSMSTIVALRPTDGVMKFMDKMSYYAKVMGGGGLFGGPADAIVKVNRSFGKLFEDLGKVDSMKLIKLDDIISSAYNLAKLDKASDMEDIMEAIGDFIAQAVETMADNADAVKSVANKTEVATGDLKQMIEQLKAAVQAMQSQNVGSEVAAALKGADLGVSVKNWPRVYPNK